MGSFYCGNNLQSPDDLNYLYFKDKSGKKYYQSLDPGRSILDKTVLSCLDDSAANLSDMKIISVPVNGFAYLYPNLASLSYNQVLAGSYYTNNITDAEGYSAQGNYTDQTVIDYFSTPNSDFVADCRCSPLNTNTNYGRVTSGECGRLYSQNPPDNCSDHVSDAPPDKIPKPTPYEPTVPRGYSGIFWTLIIITGVVLIAALVIMGLMAFGVFKSGERVLTDIEKSEANVDMTNISP